jgi:hypothetical protein
MSAFSLAGMAVYDTYNEGGFPPLKFVNKVYPPLAGAARDRYHELLKLWPDKFCDGDERSEVVRIGFNFGFGEGSIAADAVALRSLPQKLADLRARRDALAPLREQEAKLAGEVAAVETALIGARPSNYAERAHDWAVAQASLLQLSEKLTNLETVLRAEWLRLHKAHSRLVDPPELD